MCYALDNNNKVLDIMIEKDYISVYIWTTYTWYSF